MSKESLNLSVEKRLKEKARKLAERKGISISNYFEEIINREKLADDYSPEPGSAASKFAGLVPESKKREAPDYKKLKSEILKDRYDHSENTD